MLTQTTGTSVLLIRLPWQCLFSLDLSGFLGNLRARYIIRIIKVSEWLSQTDEVLAPVVRTGSLLQWGLGNMSVGLKVSKTQDWKLHACHWTEIASHCLTCLTQVIQPTSVMVDGISKPCPWEDLWWDAALGYTVSRPRSVFQQSTALAHVNKLTYLFVQHVCANRKCAQEWAQWGLFNNKVQSLHSHLALLSNTSVTEEGKGNLPSCGKTGKVQTDFHII